MIKNGYRDVAFTFNEIEVPVFQLIEPLAEATA